MIGRRFATTTIPIVFLVGQDPVKLGLVAHPQSAGREHHRGELVRIRFGAEPALAAARTRAQCGRHRSARGPECSGCRVVSEVQAAARTLRLQLLVLNARTASDIDTAFASLARERAGALVVGAGAFLLSRRDQIIALAARHAIPAIYGFREYSADGGLISYGNHIPDAFRRAGVYTGRILKGDKPADLPVEQPTKFELVINLKTAKALGLAAPSSMQLLADEVIE
jgi:putative ABC transport system substrate-binding protein